MRYSRYTVTPKLRKHYDGLRKRREQNDAQAAARLAPILAAMIARPLKG
jgi:hypothetical protein